MGKTTNILDLNNRLEKVEKENVAQNNYNSLKNRPKINGNLLTGDKTGTQLGLQDELIFDSEPTANSNNPVTSNGIKMYVDNAVSPKINKTSIQSSKALFPPAAVGVQTVTVTFPTAFAHTPIVMVSWDDTTALTNYFKYPLHITDITTTGFTVQAERLNDQDNWWFRYIAMDNQ